MNPWVGRTMDAAAYLLVAVYLVGAVGLDIPEGRQTKPGARPAYFHGGKTKGTPVLDSNCQSQGCHEAYPHKKNRTESGFRNMHQDIADCLACHGKEPEKLLVGGPRAGKKGLTLRYSGEVAKGKPHDELGQAAACRKCHSEKGRELLWEKGIHELPPGYADPIVLRMIEGGSKRWAPAELR